MKSFAINLMLPTVIFICSFTGPTPEEIIKNVQRRISDSKPITKIFTGADCSGPNGPFRTTIWSAIEGYTRFEQHTSRDTTIAGINSSMSWILNDGGITEIDSLNEAFFRGHELHLIAFDPLSRFRNPVYTGKVVFNKQPVLAIQFRDQLNNPVNIYYDASKSYPLGMEIINPFAPKADAIRVLFQEWREIGNGLFFFTKASFIQGDDVWTYNYTAIEVNNFDDSVFSPSN